MHLGYNSEIHLWCTDIWMSNYKVVQIWPGLICVYVCTNQSGSYLNHLVKWSFYTRGKRYVLHSANQNYDLGTGSCENGTWTLRFHVTSDISRPEQRISAFPEYPASWSKLVYWFWKENNIIAAHLRPQSHTHTHTHINEIKTQKYTLWFVNFVKTWLS